MRKILIIMTTTVLLLIAQISAASACMTGWYEPNVPEAMK